jgi:hypothetical protein
VTDRDAVALRPFVDVLAIAAAELIPLAVESVDIALFRPFCLDGGSGHFSNFSRNAGMKVAPPSKARQVSAAAVVGAPRTDTMPIKFATAKVCRLMRTVSLSLFGDDFAILPLLAHSFRPGPTRNGSDLARSSSHR